MSTRELEIGVATLNFARHMTLTLLDAIPDEHWFHAPLPGGNPAVWIAGHVAWEDDDCLENLVDGRGSRLPRDWSDRFAQGTRPSLNAEDYPTIAEIRTTLAALREELIGFFTASAARLADPVPDGLHGFAKDLAALMPLLACHEMIHVGQLTVIRKSLNLPPVFG